MGFADCTDCTARCRWHKRPVNTKCEYTKLAVAKCAELVLSSSAFMHYLPDLLPEDTDPFRVRVAEPALGLAAGGTKGQKVGRPVIWTVT